MSGNQLGRAIVYFLFFSAFIIILSYWTGFFYLHTPLIAFFSIALLVFIVKKEKIQISRIPPIVIGTSLIAFLLCIYPLLLVHPFYMASNDSLHTTTLRVLLINQRIPQTHEPFAGISFSYVIGFHLLAKFFHDLFFFVQDYHIIWFLGAVFASMQTMLFYLLTLELFKSERAAIFSAVLLLGTKDVFQYMFFGLMPRNIAICFLFAFFLLALKKQKSAWLFLPVIAMLHSGVFFLSLVFGFFLFLFKRERGLLKAIPTLAIAFPAFFQAYFAACSGYASTAVSINAIKSIDFLKELVSLALWMGWVPLLVFIFGLLYSLKTKSFSRDKVFSIALLATGLLGYGAMVLVNLKAANIMVWIYSIGGVLFGSLCLSEFLKGKKLEKYFCLLIIVFALTSFFASGYIQRLVQGSKITEQEAEFSLEFRQFDTGLKQTVFLTRHPAKMAELSYKIPYNALDGWFLPVTVHSNLLVKKDSAYFELMERQKRVDEIIERKCASCARDLNAYYVVIDPRAVGFDLEERPAFEKHNIKVYRIS